MHRCYPSPGAVVGIIVVLAILMLVGRCGG